MAPVGQGLKLHACLECNRPAQDPLVCSFCSIPLPLVPNLNHFQILGLPVKWNLSKAQLQLAYLARSKELHPDRFSTAREYFRRLSLQQSTRVNDAHAVLKDVLSRAIYLMEFHGHRDAASDKTHEDPELLMEIMETQEALSELRSAAARGELGGPLVETFRSLRKHHRKVEEHLTGQLVAAFEDVDQGKSLPVEKLCDLIIRMQYQKKIKHDLKELETETH